MANIATYAGDKFPTASHQAEQYVEYTEEPKRSLRDVLEAVDRRKVSIVLTTGVLALIAFAVAVKWPAVFRSAATVLVQDQEIPQDLVRPTVTSLVDERIQMISQ